MIYKFSDLAFKIENDKTMVLSGGALTSIQAQRSLGGYDYLNFAILFFAGNRYIVPFPKMYGNIKMDYRYYNFFATFIEPVRKNSPLICLKDCENNEGNGTTNKYCATCSGKRRVIQFEKELSDWDVQPLKMRNLLIDTDTCLTGHHPMRIKDLDFAIYIEAYSEKKYIIPLSKGLGAYNRLVFYGKTFTK